MLGSNYTDYLGSDGENGRKRGRVERVEDLGLGGGGLAEMLF